MNSVAAASAASQQRRQFQTASTEHCQARDQKASSESRRAADRIKQPSDVAEAKRRQQSQSANTLAANENDKAEPIADETKVSQP